MENDIYYFISIKNNTLKSVKKNVGYTETSDRKKTKDEFLLIFFFLLHNQA